MDSEFPSGYHAQEVSDNLSRRAASLALSSAVDTPNPRAIPSMDSLLMRPDVEVLIAEYGRPLVIRTLRSVIAEARSL